jgi:uncharacterized LabA/DUF88 family protein
MNRVIVYVDGFNFYYGLKSAKWKKYYWLDMVSFFEKFIKPYQQLTQINYFSAIPHNRGKEDRQDLFFSANKINPLFQLHLGKFLKKTIVCRNCKNTHITFEEKESDVRLATRMISDVVNDKCDISILVSADSDLIPPIELIKELKQKHKIFVYFPPNRQSFDLGSKADAYVKLERHEEKFANSLLPNELIHPSSGYRIVRPETWV